MGVSASLSTQTMRQSVDQLYASLRNDQIAKDKQPLTAFDEANGR